MQTNVTFEIPTEIHSNLIRGNYERVGGVIVDSKSKEVVRWLRETSVTPVSNSKLFENIGGLIQNAGSVCSMLNLGATVAFGVATLSKLSKIENRLGQIDKKLDVIVEKIDELNNRIKHVQWSVDVGFANVLGNLSILNTYNEVELISEMNNAANIMWSCQFLEPNSQQRMIRIENALSIIGSAKEKLLCLTEIEVNKSIEYMHGKRKESFDFNFDECVEKSIRRMRQCLIAMNLYANISAESGDAYLSYTKLNVEHKKVLDLYISLGTSCFLNQESVYATLLSGPYVTLMPVKRLDWWIKVFDSSSVDAFNVVDINRSNQKSNDKKVTDVYSMMFPMMLRDFDEKSTSSSKKLKTNELNNIGMFFAEMEGLYEDFDRTKGNALEYQYMDKYCLPINEYRQNMAVEIEEGNKSLALIEMA